MKISSIKPTCPDRAVPLSFSQLRLWFLDHLDEGSHQHNISMAFQLKGSLSIDEMKMAFEEIFQRHEILRSIFRTGADGPVRAISTSWKSAFRIVDLEKNGNGRENVEPDDVQMSYVHPLYNQINTCLKNMTGIDRLIMEEIARPFDLENGPLMRISLYKLSFDSFILLVTIHQIVCDRWSLNVIGKELQEIYSSLLLGKSSPLHDTTFQYNDILMEQQAWIKGEESSNELGYWISRLQGDLTVLDLPMDNPRTPERPFRVMSHSIVLPQQLVDELTKLMNHEAWSMDIIILAAFEILLQRYSGQDEIIIGTPVSGRDDARSEDVIGSFVNTTVIRSDISGNPIFRNLMDRLMETVRETYSFRRYPFEKIVKELHPHRDLTMNPIFQVWFNSMNIPEPDLVLPDLEIERILLPESLWSIDLDLTYWKAGDDINLRLSGNGNIFEESTIQLMLDQIKSLLDQLAKDPLKPICEYSLITRDTAHLLPNPSEGLSLNWEGSLTERFRDIVDRYPDHVAIRDYWDEWSYKELEQKSNLLAGELIGAGITKGDIVVIYGHRNRYLVMSLLGIWKAGAAFLILDPEFPASRLIEYLKIADPKGFIHIPQAGSLPDILSDHLDDMMFKIKAGPDDEWISAPGIQSNPMVDIGPDDIAYITFTSGSTGKPHGIVGTHGPISHFLRWHIGTFEFSESDHFSMLAGLSHDPLIRDIFTPLWIGASLYIPRRQDILDPGHLKAWMDQCGISVCHLTPALGNILVWVPESTSEITTLPSLRYAFFGGDLLTNDDMDRLHGLSPEVQIVNFYGTTETPQVMAYHIPDFPDIKNPRKTIKSNYQKKSVPLGKGIEGVQLIIMNKNRLAGIGEIGEIHVRTPYLARGYLGEENLTATRFIENTNNSSGNDRLFRTGDLGRYDVHGDVLFIGREDNQINLRGYRIEPVEIEGTIRDYPDIEQVVVTSYGKGFDDRQLVAYFVSKRNVDLVTVHLREYLISRLPLYMVPNIYMQLLMIPLTPNGKIDYDSLPIPGSHHFHDPKTTAPRDDYESRLQKIFRDILCIDNVGITDNFFEMGGHSLYAVRLMARIGNSFEIEIPLATLFRAPSIEKLASIIREKIDPISASHIVPVRTHGSRPPFFCVVPAPESALGYFNLGRYIDDQPIYLLQPSVMDHDLSKEASIQEIVMTYISEIRNVQPHGPYFLGGRCFRGVMVALEVAQHLIADGETVPFLAIFDAVSPVPALPRSTAWAKKHPSIYYPLQKASYKMNTRLSRDRSEKIKKCLVRITRLIFGKQRARALYHAFMRDTRDSYSAWPYPGYVKVYWCKENRIMTLDEAHKRWSKLVTGELDVQAIQGNHGTMFHEPHVKTLARTFNDDLQNSMEGESIENNVIRKEREI